MTEEEVLRLLEEAWEEAHRMPLPPAADSESLYEQLGRHAESGASAH